MKELLTAVSTVGFPIVCCGALYWQSLQNTKLYQESIVTITQKLQEILDKLEELEGEKHVD